MTFLDKGAKWKGKFHAQSESLKGVFVVLVHEYAQDGGFQELLSSGSSAECPRNINEDITAELYAA